MEETPTQTISRRAINPSSPKQPLRERFLAALFDGMRQLFCTGYSASTKKRKRALVLASETFLTCQVLSLLALGTEGSRGVIWGMLEYVRVDVIAWKCGVLRNFGYALAAFPLVLGLVFLIYTVCLVHSSYSRRVSYWVKLGFDLQCCYLFLPTLLFLASVTNLAFLDNGNVTISGSSPEDYAAELGLPALLAIAALLLLKYLYVIGTTEVAHTKAKRLMYAKAHSALDVAEVLAQTGLVVFVAFRGEQHPQYTASLVAGLFGTLLYRSVILQPFYNTFVMKVCVGAFATKTFTSAAFLVGQLVGGPLLVSFLGLIVMPFAVAIVLWKFQHIEGTNQLGLESVLGLELSLRKELLASRPKKQLLTAFSQFFCERASNRAKMLVAWEVLYTIYALNHAALAKIRLAKCRMAQRSFEGDYQIFKCKKEVELMPSASADEGQFVNYMASLEDVKEKDRDLSIQLLLFLDLVKDPDLAKLHNISEKIHNNLSKVSSLYEDIHKNYDPTQELTVLLSTFYSCVLTDEVRARQIYQDFNIIKNNVLSNKNTLETFNDDTCVMIVSANQQSAGVIMHANSTASRLFKLPVEELVGSQLINFIPSPVRGLHKGMFQAFFMHTIEPRRDFAPTLTIHDANMNLVECYFSVQAVARGENMMFLVTMREVCYAHAILLSDNFQVLGQTVHVPELMNGRDVVGQHFTDIFHLPFEALSPMEPYSTILYGKPCFLVYVLIYLRGTHLRWVYMFETGTEADTFISNPRKIKASKETIESEPQSQQAKPITKGHIKFVEADSGEDCVGEGTPRKLEESISLTKSLGSTFTKTMSQQEANRLFIQETRSSLKRFSIGLSIAVTIAAVLSAALTLYLYLHIHSEGIFRSFEELQKLRSAVLSISNNVRDIDLSLADTSAALPDLQSRLNQVDDFMREGDEYLQAFDECGLYKFLTHTLVPVWVQADVLELQTMYYYDFLSMLVMHTNNYLAEDSLGSKEFILANCVGFADRHLKTTMKQLEVCNEVQNEEKDAKFQLALVFANLTILASLAVMMVLAVKIRRSTRHNWENIVEQFKQYGAEYETGILERLEKLLHTLHPGSSSRSDAKPTLDMSLLPFIWRLVMIEVLFVAFFYFTFFYVHDLLDASLYNRNYLGLVFAKVSLHEIEFWAKETVFQDSDKALTQSFTELYPFLHVDLALANTLGEWHEQLNLLVHEAGAFMLADEYEHFFASCPANEELGCYFAMTAVYQEANRLLTEQDVYVLADLLEDIRLLQAENDVIFASLITNSITAANELLDYVLIIDALFIVLLVTSICIAFVPFLKKQGNYLKYRKSIISILPSLSMPAVLPGIN